MWGVAVFAARPNHETGATEFDLDVVAASRGGTRRRVSEDVLGPSEPVGELRGRSIRIGPLAAAASDDFWMFAEIVFDNAKGGRLQPEALDGEFLTIFKEVKIFGG